MMLIRKNFIYYLLVLEFLPALSENLRMAGISSVEKIRVDITTQQLSVPENANGVVVDIGTSVEVDKIMLTIHSQIPRGSLVLSVWVIAIQ
ncbi:Uncharacterised protein [Serratia fonticola]|uniref:Uncharacterized protein n=1 Tax=Serratia fonticola TaxID=47917 RepID=A0A4U9WBV0_SERFO|nr:Uncharacterised protein [Serratia fonticola]